MKNLKTLSFQIRYPVPFSAVVVKSLRHHTRHEQICHFSIAKSRCVGSGSPKEELHASQTVFSSFVSSLIDPLFSSSGIYQRRPDFVPNVSLSRGGQIHVEFALSKTCDALWSKSVKLEMKSCFVGLSSAGWAIRGLADGWGLWSHKLSCRSLLNGIGMDYAA